MSAFTSPKRPHSKPDRFVHGLLVVAVGFAVWWSASLISLSRVSATPIYAVRSTNNCATCHIEPVGWYDPPDIADRKCTMECSSCHISRNGGGLRTPSGKFYGQEALPTFGDRPGAKANPEKYRNPETKSTEGRYRLWDGFSGWDRGGNVPMAEIKDRFGDIDPDPRFLHGADLRVLAIGKEDADFTAFPMQAEMYAAWLFDDHWKAYGSVGLQGDRRRTFNNPGGARGDSIDDYVTIRELFLEYAPGHSNTYVRAGRFTKPYGWRMPDHTSFVRGGLQQDQFSQVFGVEAGYNPQYPYVNVALYAQGLDGWPGDRAIPGVGGVLNAGIRELGWQLGTSAEYLYRTEDDASQVTAGPQWAVNLYPLVYMGEVDLRAESGRGREANTRIGLFAYHELNYLVTTGVTLMLKYDWADPDISIDQNAVQRLTFGTQWDVYTGWQVAAQYRLNTLAGQSTGNEALLWMHVYY